jgi:hypothetical protein
VNVVQATSPTLPYGVERGQHLAGAQLYTIGLFVSLRNVNVSPSGHNSIHHTPLIVNLLERVSPVVLATSPTLPYGVERGQHLAGAQLYTISLFVSLQNVNVSPSGHNSIHHTLLIVNLLERVSPVVQTTSPTLPYGVERGQHLAGAQLYTIGLFVSLRNVNVSPSGHNSMTDKSYGNTFHTRFSRDTVQPLHFTPRKKNLELAIHLTEEQMSLTKVTETRHIIHVQCKLSINLVVLIKHKWQIFRHL